MSPETFSIAYGATWRLEYSDPERGVFWKQLANFHCSISETYRRADGELVYRITGQGAQRGRRFSFEIPARQYNQHRAFMRAVSAVAGAGSAIWPGNAAAFRRAVMEATTS